MDHRRGRRRELAALGLVIGLVASGLAPDPARAGRAPRASAQADADSGGRAAGQGLGSPGNPIPLAGTETRAALLVPVIPPTAFDLHLGPLRLTLRGIAAAVRGPGGVRDSFMEPPAAVDSDLYSGGAIGVELPRSAGLYVEGGRVLFHDPLRVMGRDAPGSDDWTSAAGLEVRF